VSTKKTDCAQTPIIPHLQVNNGEVLDTDKVSVFTGDSIVLSPEAGSDGLWNWSGCGASGINNIQTIHPNGTCTSVVVTYTNTCKAQTALQYAVTVKPKVGMLSSEYNNNVLIYPNPAVSGIFTIKVPDYLIGNKIIIYNLVGEQVYGNSLTGSVNIINSGLTPGMYIFKVSGKGSFISEKLILK
jgi:hypothetical protein